MKLFLDDERPTPDGWEGLLQHDTYRFKVTQPLAYESWILHN
jgi:hypothetical protein